MRIICSHYDYFYNGMNEIRLVQVSDLHNRKYPANELIKKIILQKPDIIVVTGDFLNRHKPTETAGAIDFFIKAVKICPIYCIEGNHEYALRNITNWRKLVEDIGVIVLDNRFVDLSIRESRFRLAGAMEQSSEQDIAAMQSENTLTVTLSHRPERIDLYQRAGCDLVLCGHAHGGQVRIFGRGLFSPEQGVFPKYTKGKYQKEDTVLIVSTGLGNTVLVPRVFNPAEIVTITLR